MTTPPDGRPLRVRLKLFCAATRVALDADAAQAVRGAAPTRYGDHAAVAFVAGQRYLLDRLVQEYFADDPETIDDVIRR